MLKVMNKTAVTRLKNPVASILCVLLLFTGLVVPLAAQISPARDLTGKWQSPFTCVYYELDPFDPNTRMTDVNARFVVNVNQQGNQVDIIMSIYPVSWKEDPAYAKAYPDLVPPPPVEDFIEFTGTVEGTRVTAYSAGVLTNEGLDGSFTTDLMMLTLTGNAQETDVNGISLVRATLTEFGSGALVRGSAWVINGDTGEKEPITSPVQMTSGTVIQTGDNAIVGFSYPDQGGVVYLGENSEAGWVGIQQQTSPSGQIGVELVPPFPKLPIYEEGLIPEGLSPAWLIIEVIVGVGLLGHPLGKVLIIAGILLLPEVTAYVKDTFSPQQDVCYVKPLAVPQGMLLSNGTEFTVNVSNETTRVQVLNGSVIYVDPITNNTITFGPNQVLTLPKAQQAGFSEPELESDVSTLDPNSVTRWWPQTTGGFSPVDYINNFLRPITQPIGNAINDALGNYIPRNIISFLFVDQPIVLAVAILAIVIMIASAIALHRRRVRMRAKKAKDASSQTAVRPPPPELTPLTASTPQGEKKFAFCPNCGERLPSFPSHFCPFCGASLAPSGETVAEKPSETKISNDRKGEISEPKTPGKKDGTSKTLAKNVARHGWKFKVAVSFLTVIIATNTVYYFGVFKMNPALQPAQQIMDQIWSTPVLVQVHSVITQIVQGIQNLAAPSNQSGNQNNTSPAVGAQVWDLTNDAGQTATVVVLPFTYSGTFSETSSSAGWWARDDEGAPIFRFQVGGNIAHNSQGDIWSFVGLAGAGGGYQGMGTASGTANGNFPNATTVHGTYRITFQSPLGTSTVTGTWSGVKR